MGGVRSASGCPSVTVSPIPTWSSATVASRSATISCSIFIASITTTGAPAATCSSVAAGVATTVPVNGATSVWLISAGTGGSLRFAAMSEAPVLLWEPSDERVAHATLTRFAGWLSDERGLSFGSYEELWRWSVDSLDEFWAAVVAYFDVRIEGGDGAVLGDRSMPGAEWFPGARTSYAEHVFRGKDPDAVAIRHASEVRPELGEWTWGRLRAETARIAAGLRALGVVEGDRVVAYMPNIPETVAAFLACASIGATWSSAAPEFGARSVIDRFAQVEPKVLLAVDGYGYGGKEFDRSGQVERIAAELPGLENGGRAWAIWTGAAGRTGSSAPRTRSWSSRRCRLTTRCGCCTRAARPGCPSRSSMARAGSCWSRSRRCTCTSTRRPAIGSSGSRRPAG